MLIELIPKIECLIKLEEQCFKCKAKVSDEDCINKDLLWIDPWLKHQKDKNKGLRFCRGKCSEWYNHPDRYNSKDRDIMIMLGELGIAITDECKENFEI